MRRIHQERRICVNPNPEASKGAIAGALPTAADAVGDRVYRRYWKSFSALTSVP
jgi:hypothetical protein